MRKALSKSALIALGTLLVAGCSSQPRYSDHGYSGNNRCDSCGTIANIESVWVNDSRVGGGTVLGAIIGGAIGNQVGSGSGRRAATVAGAVAGGVIGHEIEDDRRDQRRGFLIEVPLDDGRYGQVTQMQDPQLRVGDRVIIRDDRVYALR
ncbi:MAG: glycine zipper 2TM domain-containing protein [Ahniella sp.]|nr:glycine zipper 2TM domain-containing protein [Ahniella sp.]